MLENFFRGWNSIGLKTTPQPNNGNPNGAFYGPLSLKAVNQSRSSAADGYYRPIVGKRSNFHLITGQTVSKINFDKNKVATSVNVSTGEAVGVLDVVDMSNSVCSSQCYERSRCDRYQGLPGSHPRRRYAAQPSGSSALWSRSDEVASSVWHRHSC